MGWSVYRPAGEGSSALEQNVLGNQNGQTWSTGPNDNQWDDSQSATKSTFCKACFGGDDVETTTKFCKACFGGDVEVQTKFCKACFGGDAEVKARFCKACFGGDDVATTVAFCKSCFGGDVAARVKCDCSNKNDDNHYGLYNKWAL